MEANHIHMLQLLRLLSKKLEFISSLANVFLIWLGWAPVNKNGSFSLIKISAPDKELYRPLFQPWRAPGLFDDIWRNVENLTVNPKERAWVQHACIQQVASLSGDFWEAGVYKGGTAVILRQTLEISCKNKMPTIRCFDTFAGMPQPDQSQDSFDLGAYSDTSLETVRSVVGDDPFIHYHQGFIPDTFVGLEGASISYAHIDVDLYQSVFDCCAFIYPRMLKGGVMIFDDYGSIASYGARTAVNDFFQDKAESPLVLPGGQALLWRL
jgi:O-methyltransferase